MVSLSPISGATVPAGSSGVGLEAERALTALDSFALDLLALVYEYDHYFPGLLDDPVVAELLNVRLPARVAAARAGLCAGAGASSLETFCVEQIQRTRVELRAAIDDEEASAALNEAGDMLYHWLRRHDCVAAESVSVAVLVRRGDEVLLTQRADGQWDAITGYQRPGESIEEAASREAGACGLNLTEVSGILASSYDYLGDNERLCLTVFLLADSAQDLPSNDQFQFYAWERPPDSLRPPLRSLLESGFKLTAPEDDSSANL